MLFKVGSIGTPADASIADAARRVERLALVLPMLCYFATGILLAFGMAFPNRMILLMFPPIPMKAKYMVVLFGLIELGFGISGRSPGVANFAHLGGMLFGFLLIQYWRNARKR